MSSASAYSREWYQAQYGRLTFSAQVSAAGTTENILAVRNASYRIFVQSVQVTPTTDAAETITFQDDAGTPVPVAVYDGAAAPVNLIPYLADFGPEGVPLTTGLNLDMVVGAGGALRARVHVSSGLLILF